MDIRKFTSTPASTRPLTPPGTSSFADQAFEAFRQRGVLGTTSDVFVGAGEALWDVAKGFGSMIAHPIDTAKGIGTLVTKLVSSPGEGFSALGHAFTDPYLRAVQDGHPGKALGRGLVEIGSLFVSPSEIVGAAKASVAGAHGALGALHAGGDFASALKAASLAANYSAQSAELATKALQLSELGYAAEAAKVSQYARVSARVAEVAQVGDCAKASRYAGLIDRVQNVVVGSQVMSLGQLMDHSGQLLSAGSAAARLGSRAAMAQAVTAEHVVAALPSYERMMQLAARSALSSPYLRLTPTLAVSMGMIDGVLPAAAQLGKLTPEKAQAIAAQYELEPDVENVHRFLAEAGAYPQTALGPHLGTSDQIRQVQAALRVAGYDIKAHGTYDEATILAVMDFKREHGLHQTYKQSNGAYAVNEYLDQQTASALYDLVQSIK